MVAEYEIFKQEMDRKQYFAMREAQRVADKAYNKGLLDAVKWKNPLIYFMLKRP